MSGWQAAARERPVSGWLAAALLAYLRSVAGSTRPVGAADAARAWADLEAGGRRLFLYYWTETGIPLILWGCMENLRLDRELAFVHDETLGGRVTGEVVRRLGRAGWPLRHARPGTRARDVGRLIASSTSIGMAVDGRGPYRQVGAAFARLVERAGAVAVPLAIHASRSVRLHLGGPLDLPRRGTALAVRFGSPIDCTLAHQDLRARLQSELEAASAAVRRRLDGVEVSAGARG